MNPSRGKELDLQKMLNKFPADERIMIKGLIPIDEVSLIDLTGKQFILPSGEQIYNVSKFQGGCYILRVISGVQTVDFPVIIK